MNMMERGLIKKTLIEADEYDGTQMTRMERIYTDFNFKDYKES